MLGLKLNAKTVLLGLGLFALTRKGQAKPARPPTLTIPKDSTVMTLAQLRALALSVGFPDPDLAAAVAMAESGGHTEAVGDSGKSFGLWQVNLPSHPTYQPSLLLTPSYNAAAAFEISKSGTNWQPWTTYRNGAYTKYMPSASAAPQIAPVKTAGTFDTVPPAAPATEPTLAAELADEDE